MPRIVRAVMWPADAFSLLVIWSGVVWQSHEFLFVVSPALCRGKYLLDICTKARGNERMESCPPCCERPGVPSSLQHLPWVVGRSQVHGTLIVMVNVPVVCFRFGVQGLLLPSVILLACRYPGLAREMSHLSPLLRGKLQRGGDSP